MSHIVQTSKAKGPDAGQTGLSSSPKHGLINEWYSAVAITCRRAGVPPSTWTRPRWSSQRASVRVRTTSNTGSGSLPHSCRRFLRACAQPRIDGLSRPRRTHEQQAERGQRGLPDAVEVQPGAALDEPAVVPEHLAPP